MIFTLSEIEKIKEKLLEGQAFDFDALALSVFQFQSAHCQVYKQYIKYLNIKPAMIHTIGEIPFLPVSLFKEHVISSLPVKDNSYFLSSGTSGQIKSRHIIHDLTFYHKICAIGFEHFFGPLKDWLIIAALPSYLEQGHSSLISMITHFIDLSGNKKSGFYTPNSTEARAHLNKNTKDKILLFGVGYALVEMAENISFNNPNIHVMETGGMKGRGKEIIRSELHRKLAASFKPNTILSEYGMTELSTQAYSLGGDIFHCSPYMHIFTRSIQDPFEFLNFGQAGALNIIDLGNIHSCSFIATEDIGRRSSPNTFTVEGRTDYSDIRGCNLLSF